MSQTSSFPSLPTELIREIFEFAATDRQVAIALTLVSSHIRQWTLPFLYHSVTLSSPRSLKNFLSSISSHGDVNSRLTPRIALHRRVRNLGIFALGSMQAIEAIISACTEVTSLACSFSLYSLTHCSPTSHVKIPPRVREQHFLGLACRDGFDLSMLVPTISHLNVQLTSGTFSFLRQLPAYLPLLTHLAITAVSASPDLRNNLCSTLESLLECATLEVLLIQDASFTETSILKEDIDRWNADGGGLKDVRLVAQKPFISPVRQWEEIVDSGNGDLWEEALLEVRERKARAIAAHARHQKAGDS